VQPLTPGQFLVALAIGIAAALFVFRDAEKRGNKRATAWGIAAFLASGVVLPVYFIRVWLRGRK
jgi:drug/metabolite transporter (DMT)-like permease